MHQCLYFIFIMYFADRENKFVIFCIMTALEGIFFSHTFLVAYCQQLFPLKTNLHLPTAALRYCKYLPSKLCLFNKILRT